MRYLNVAIKYRNFYFSYYTLGNINLPSILELRQYQNALAFCEKHVCFEIAALFPSPTRQGKKGGNFKTSMRFTETNPFLYCLSSSLEVTKLITCPNSFLKYLRSNILMLNTKIKPIIFVSIFLPYKAQCSAGFEFIRQRRLIRQKVTHYQLYLITFLYTVD